MNLLHKARQLWQLRRFDGSAEYWDERYRLGGNSGTGSYGAVARFKAAFLNRFVTENGIETVLELGCGDGAQLALSKYPNYIGLDVSKTAVDKCAKMFTLDDSKYFSIYDKKHSDLLSKFLISDVTLSQDVIYHLVEDDAYESYLRLMFGASRRFAIFFSSNKDEKTIWPHVRHRKFTEYAQLNFPNFQLMEIENNPHSDESFADFYVFKKI